MTAPSLIIAGVEVIDKSVNSAVRLASGFDFGEGDPDQTVIASLYLDGDAVAGRRAKNRQMRLPLNVYGTGLALTSTINAILQAVDAEAFTVQWTPADGVPVVFDCFRASWERPRDPNREAGGRSPLILTFAAKPYGRSPILQSVTAAASDTQLDSFATAPTTGAALDTSVKYEGTGSAKVTLGSTVWWATMRSYATTAPIARTYASAKDMTAMRAVTMRMRWPAPGGAATVTAYLTLTSAAGNVTIVASKKFINGDTNWRLVSFPLTGNLGSLDVTTVTGYSMTLASSPMENNGATTSNLWVDDQRMRPASSALTSTTHGASLLLPGIVGSARAPVSLALSNGSTFSAFLLHTPPVDQDVDAQILTSLSSASADQTVTIAAAGARFSGTYSVVLGVSTVGSGSTTTTVTVTQKVNGTVVGSTTILARTYAAGPHLIPVGEVTLPLYAVPDDNSTTTYDFEVAASGTERYTELMLLDTRGQTVYTDTDLVSARAYAYVDEPTSLQSGSLVYSTVTDRTAAFSAMGHVMTSGGPVLLEPGDNKVLAWVGTSTPSVTATYYPRWLDERVV